MYNPSNFVINLNAGQLINIVTGGTASLIFNIENKDLVDTLYNLSFTLTLGDGVILINSSIPYTSVNGNIYSFTNIKDLAPNEIDYKVTIDIKLNTTTSNGNPIPFGTLIPCSFQASADTMPRGNYDNNNEIIQALSSFSFSASKYIIYKVNPPALLLGKSYSSKIIIQTSTTTGITFDSIKDILGNGLIYLGNLIITGYSSSALSNVQVIMPSGSNNSYQLLWSSIWIPANTIVTIQYDVKFNERYYINGSATGAYIENGSSISNQLLWIIEGITLSSNYTFIAYEIILQIVLSKYVVDINESLIYSIYFYGNLYHDLLSLSGYLTTSDGQILANSSTPMYASKNISSGGITQVTWNVGSVAAGSTAVITIGGTIASQYLSSGLNILAGDTLNISSICNAISAANNKVISSSDSAILSIGIPSVSKVITGYYYADNTPKSYNVLAPGDHISYKSTYNSTNVSAPANQVKLFDFYPYMTTNINGINYEYSSTDYPGTGVVPVDPNGVLWFVNEIPGNQSFDINYNTQIDYTNNGIAFPYNLFKMQVVNSNGIAYSSRSQVEFTLGTPNLILNKTVSPNDPNNVRIGNIYTLSATLTNDNSKTNVTDGFNITFTESLPSGVTLDSQSIVAKLDGITIPSSILGNSIIINIPNLAPGSIFTLTYNISINDTLGPNENFIFISSSTVPYTQVYDETRTNLQYNLSGLTAQVILSSKPILLTLSSDTPTKIVGDTVYYTLNITIPIGQKLSSLYGLILIPSAQSYSDNAWLNDTPITATLSNSRVIFPTINNIDTTTSSITYSYRIQCLISNSIISTQNPLYTLETYYGNLGYVTMLNDSNNIGVNNTLVINHPHVDINIGSSNVMNGFVSSYIINNTNTLYTKVMASNISSVTAKNIDSTITLPNYLNFNSVVISSSGVNSSYNSQTKTLTMTVSTINSSDSQYLIFKSNLLLGVYASNTLIISGNVNEYFNSISTTKIYTSDLIFNNQLYINSLLSFLPLSFYALVGSNAAINLSRIGEPTQIEYILTNTGQGIDSYTITLTPIAYEYDVYIGTTFIETVAPNSFTTVTSPLLTNINPGNSKYITLKYTIPLGTQEPFYGTTLVTATSLNNSNTTKLIPTTLQDP
ncbi:MAG: hypothetical protein RR891_01660 [Clostridium sp.]|uniref:hypothetical protein n=1 Tax=Clostridium sp. TaxID=1506 RepID=UPI0030444A95